MQSTLLAGTRGRVRPCSWQPSSGGAVACPPGAARQRLRPVPAAKPGNDPGWADLVIDFVNRATASPRPGGSIASRKEGPLPPEPVHYLLALLVAVWLLGTYGGSPLAKALVLDHNPAKWWAPLSDALWSASPEQLARNCFMAYMFGRVVQRAESGQGLALTYALSAAGGSLAALLLLPRQAPVHSAAMTGALAGLFAMAVTLHRNVAWTWHRAVQLAVLAPFVAAQLAQGHAGMAQHAWLAGVKVGQWVPLLGGVAGACCAAALLRLAHALAASAKAQQARGAAAEQQQQQPDDVPASVLVAAKAVSRFLRKLL